MTAVSRPGASVRAVDLAGATARRFPLRFMRGNVSYAELMRQIADTRGRIERL